MSGVPNDEIAAIERAMLARLQTVAAADPAGFAWRTLTTYPEDFDAYLAASTHIACPAAWVVFAGWNSTEIIEDEGDWTSGTLLVRGATFGLMVADENLRAGEQYQRHGGPDAVAEPGSYRLALAAVRALANQDLGLLSTPLRPGALRHVAATDASAKRRMSRFACELTCDFMLALTGPDEDPAELHALHANFDIDVFGQPVPVDRDLVKSGQQLPDDAHADATDHLELN